MRAGGKKITGIARRSVALVALALAMLMSQLGVARADPGDAKKATILVKAMSFDLDLDARIGDALVVAIVYKAGDPGSEAIAATWSSAFAQLGSLRVKNAAVRAIRVPFDAAAIEEAVQKQGVDALLVCDGLDGDIDVLSRIALSRKLITVGAQRAYVDRGLVLGTFLEEDKRRIVVNLKAARQGGFRFSSAMLRLAVLIK